MDESVISWSIPNFITISLMVLVLGALLFFGKRSWDSWQS